MMRINKYIANCGFCSRREADFLLDNDKVLLNGKIAAKGENVDDTDVVEIDGKILCLTKEKKYFMLNKPVGYTTTLKDNFAKNKVIDLFDVKERIYPVGRLDKDSFGLLLFTNDGDLAFKLTHPSHNVEKEYIVKVNKDVKPFDIKKLCDGVVIDGKITRKARFIVDGTDSMTVKVFLKEGRNRQIRKMFDSLGYKVVSLQRISFGNIKLGNLKIGNYRELTKEEVSYLRSL
ncbi:MAG: pseudouridine synthase [Peptoniphilaceae bacterium]|uniref:pseudouridine synthase n=1 Tax=Parvimonas sp. TaxID=1944660 RepID=UPI0025D54BA7|nr:pseudouridine synthase [Parvimonas sp.]MCI5997582.1 rRNA pseudouridine synthase [Parvimonas sp.]MDD7765177.1 pseudouridine synthase [Peptoniphilaceae bacterium]MDY3051206.1 pseudouridine synthase [Parvimonas sp.]